LTYTFRLLDGEPALSLGMDVIDTQIRSQPVPKSQPANTSLGQ
jgi:hypothetical protein